MKVKNFPLLRIIAAAVAEQDKDGKFTGNLDDRRIGFADLFLNTTEGYFIKLAKEKLKTKTAKISFAAHRKELEEKVITVLGTMEQALGKFDEQTGYDKDSQGN